MILNRLGNKERLAPLILPFFPEHAAYCEPFFGSGAMYFLKTRKAKYNFLNDLDDDVYNLFRQVVDNREELVYWLERVPITETQFFEWGDGKKEELPVLRAVRFLILSNYGLYGKTNTMRHAMQHNKEYALTFIEQMFDKLRGAHFLNTDFRTFFNRLDCKTRLEDWFCYCDPPYLETDDNYSHSFAEQDSLDLFNTLQASGMKWAMSEFDHPFILQQATERGLRIHEIVNRRNLGNRRTEILITNYQPPQLQLF